MVHFPGFARARLWIHRAVARFYRAGFPHSEIPGSMPACGSPRLIAACHVLHRLLLPRHPPCALSSLTTKFTQRTSLKLPAASDPLSAQNPGKHAGKFHDLFVPLIARVSRRAHQRTSKALIKFTRLVLVFTQSIQLSNIVPTACAIVPPGRVEHRCPKFGAIDLPIGP